MSYRVRGESLVVSPAAIHPNDWNPNQMDERRKEALRESLEEHGMVDELLCRAHPTIEEGYEVIDGEHRWLAIIEFALEHGEHVPIRVIDADDAEARKLTIIMNETRGSADKVDLARLLAELEKDYGDDLGKGLPYSDTELQELVALASHAWEDYGDEWADGEESENGDDGWVRFEVAMTTEDYEAFAEAKERIAEIHALSGDAEIQHGQVIHALTAEYLASEAGIANE